MGKRQNLKNMVSKKSKEIRGGGFDMSNLNFFGGIGAGVTCDADDTSFFCQLTKFSAVVSQLLFLIGVLVMVYFAMKIFILPMLSGKSGQKGGRKYK
jgi:hypothetical protein